MEEYVPTHDLRMKFKNGKVSVSCPACPGWGRCEPVAISWTTSFGLEIDVDSVYLILDSAREHLVLSNDLEDLEKFNEMYPYVQNRFTSPPGEEAPFSWLG